MRRFVSACFVLALVLPVAISCSDANDDSVGRACKTIVQVCGAGSSMGDCIDQIGGLPPDCVDCIGGSGCGYAACQRLAECRIPVDFLK
jgi:hypothetical protein